MAYENLKSTGIKYLLTKLKGYLDGRFLKKGEGITSVNGNTADAHGNVSLISVPLADNLNSSLNQTSIDSFIFRTAGGALSIKSGDASMTKIMGEMNHAGYNAESVVAEASGDIQATVNNATFLAQMQTDSGEKTFTYTSSWSENLETYGITVTGTPTNGDTIAVTFQKLTLGTITQSNPESFVATGWNLYDHEHGYARVKKYSSEPGEKFGIAGAYTGLMFSTTIEGQRSAIAVNEGTFEIIADGYVWVTGGDSTTTEIWMTWKDWNAQANSGVFEPYREAVIDFSEIMTEYFPNGLMRAGTYRDEINLTTGKAYSRVGKIENTAANLEEVQTYGTDYDYDGSWIYYGRTDPEEITISIPYTYTSDDHGNELFTGTEIPVYAEILYGNNLKNKLERDVLTKSADLVDNLTSTSTTKALTAKQGKLLNDALVGKAEIQGKTLNWNSLRKAAVILENNSRYLIAVLSANENSQALVLANCGSSGTVNALVISKGSNLTITTAANRVWFEAGSTVTCRAYWLTLGQGD